MDHVQTDLSKISCTSDQREIDEALAVRSHATYVEGFAARCWISPQWLVSKLATGEID